MKNLPWVPLLDSLLQKAGRGRERLPIALDFILSHCSIYKLVKALLGMQRQILYSFNLNIIKLISKTVLCSNNCIVKTIQSLYDTSLNGKKYYCSVAFSIAIWNCLLSSCDVLT